MKKLLYLLPLLSLYFGSCENEIPYHLDEVSPKLVMNAFINADSLENILYLNLTGKSQVSHIEEATVEIRVNGKLQEIAQPLEAESYSRQKRFLIKSRFETGDVVRIDAQTKDGAHHAWIEETVPHRVELMDVDTFSVPSTYGGAQFYMGPRFKDRPDERNYYRIVIEKRKMIHGQIPIEQKDTTILQKDFSFWPWNDMALTDGNPASSEELDNEMIERVKNIYGVFDDSWFLNQEYQMIVNTSLYIDSSTPLINSYVDIDVAVRLLSITKAEFYYLKTLNFIDSDILDEYVSDPVKIPSNVNGGIGFVGISKESGVIFKVIEGVRLDYWE